MKLLRSLFVFALLAFAPMAFADRDPFSALSAGSVTVAATTASAATALAATNRSQVLVYNAGPSMVFVEFGLSGKTAAVTTALPVPVGVIYVLSIDPTFTHIATITGAGTATVYVTVGAGN